MQTPTFSDVLRARQVVYEYLSRTPLHSYPGLSDLVGAEILLKHENHHALGAFKVRGGVNFLAHLSDEERRRGVITASTGNHGQSIAYAGKVFGVKTVIVLPEASNPSKVASLRALGAELVFNGKVFDESLAHSKDLVKEYGYRFVHPANEPLLIAGVATYSLEILEDDPSVEYIFVPLGGGSGACGACIVAKAVNPGIKVIAVQSEEAPAGYRSWKERRLVQRETTTFAEGIATMSGYDLTQRILWELLDDFILVSDEEIKEAMVHLMERAHTLAEGAGATALAGAIKVRDRIQGKRVVAVVSGGNVALSQLTDIFQDAG